MTDNEIYFTRNTKRAQRGGTLVLVTEGARITVTLGDAPGATTVAIAAEAGVTVNRTTRTPAAPKAATPKAATPATSAKAAAPKAATPATSAKAAAPATAKPATPARTTRTPAAAKAATPATARTTRTPAARGTSQRARNGARRADVKATVAGRNVKAGR